MGDFLFYAGAIGFCGGILLGTLYGSELTQVVWLMGLSLVLAMVWRRGGDLSATSTETTGAASSAQVVLLLSILVFAASLGYLRVELASWSAQSSELASSVGSEITLTGVIIREPDIRERTQHLYIELNEVNETVLVFTDRYGRYQYGDTVEVVGTLDKPTSFETDLGRTFNYPGYLKAQRVSYLLSFGEVVVTKSGDGNPLVRNLLSFKQSFMRQIELLIPEPEVGLSEGLLLGVKQALGDELERVFRSTGIIHIVVLSGYNIALVVIFVRYILAYLLPYRLQLVFGLLAIVAFALMVGLSATVVRASLMASFILFAKYIGRTYAVMRGLVVAGLVMLILNPYLLTYDVGFQLSFLATAGLILLAPPLERWFTWMPTFLKLREFLLATIATQIFVLPILLYQIGEFSVVSVLVNVLVLPMVPVAMFLTFVTGLLSFVSLSLALPLVYLTTWSLKYILEVAVWFAALPFAAYTVPAFSFWLVPVLYFGLAYFIWRLYHPVVVSRQKFSHWTIEEESDVKARLLEEGVGDEGQRPSSPTPLFFK